MNHEASPPWKYGLAVAGTVVWVNMHTMLLPPGPTCPDIAADSAYEMMRGHYRSRAGHVGPVNCVQDTMRMQREQSYAERLLPSHHHHHHHGSKPGHSIY